jgi:hypothetical protein
MQSLLERESQTAFGALSRSALSLADKERVITIYKLAAQSGAQSEYPIHREPGVTFNPRPARILLLLLKEGRCSYGRLVSAAPLVTLPVASITSIKELIETPEGILARDAHISPDSSPEAATLALTLALDAIRHLHMTILSTEEQQEKLNYYRELRDKLHCYKGNIPERLQLLFETALTRYNER